MVGWVSSRLLVVRQSPRRSVENQPAFIPLAGTRARPRAMAARLRSRLRIGDGEGVREQETEPGTPVTGQVSGATAAPWAPGRNPPAFNSARQHCETSLP